jgi:putative methyltransferase (TIGR04325 family)
MSRARLKAYLPPVLLHAWRALAGGAITFRGDYASWAAARAASKGYDDAAIVTRAREAALKVRRGEAAMDRDGVAFERPEYAFAVIAALQRAVRDGALRVLDFGGALGGSYRQFLAFGAAVPRLDWRVVEQPGMAAAGREGYADASLRFFDSTAGALRDGPPDVVLLSSVLQYLPEPYRVLEELGAIPGATLVLDRTPCDEGARDLLCVQTVPPSIYPASYPCWIFSRARLEAALGARHVVRAAFTDASSGWRSDRGEFALRGYVCDPGN